MPWRIALLATMLSASLWGQVEGRRKALVIGSSAYRRLSPLVTSVSDARAIAAALRGVGFQVTLAENPDLEQMAQQIDGFLHTVRAGEAGLFYYAGYAIQVGGENYLLPAAFDPDASQDIDYTAYSVTRVVRQMESRKPEPAVILLDAAWPDPALSRRYPEEGLALVEPRSPETVVAFSALPRHWAPAAAGAVMSVYAQAWVETLGTPGLALDQALQNVKRLVSQTSRGGQVPAHMSTAVREFVFRPKPPQLAEWERIRDTNSLEILEEFRRKYPGDPLAAQALRRMEELEWNSVSGTREMRALRAFVAKYPQSEFAANARAAIAVVEKTEQEAARRGVLDTLKRYQDAYQRKDLDQLKSLRPGLGRNELRVLEETFRFARSVRMELELAGEPRVETDVATAECRQTIQIRDERGLRPPNQARVNIRLRKVRDEWLIDSIQ